MPAILMDGLRFAFKFTAGYFLAYLLIGSYVYDGAISTLSIVMSVVGEPSSRFKFFDYKMFIDTFCGGVMALSCWESQRHLFEVFFTETISSARVVDPIGVLLSGLKSYRAPYFRYMAFLDLIELARFDRKRRAMIFDDVDSSSTSWEQVSSLCMQVLDKLSTTIEDTHHIATVEGAPTSVQSLVSDTSKSQFANQEVPRPQSTSPKSGAKTDPTIFVSPSKSSLVGSLLPKQILQPQDTNKQRQEPPLESPVFSPVSSLRGGTPSKSTYPPLLLRSSVPEPKPTGDGKKDVMTPAKERDIIVSTIRQWIEKYRWGRALLCVTTQRQTKALFADIQLHIWAAQALAALVVASASEDRYGTVHRHLPQVLECLVRCLCAVEQHAAKSSSSDPYVRTNLSPFSVPFRDASGGGFGAMKPLESAQLRKRLPVGKENGRANLSSASITVGRKNRNQPMHKQTAIMINVLETAIYRITTTFNRHISRYQFSPLVAKKLQNFVDFKE
ncbi:Nucleoporin NDC1 [Quaeritorhiza haematococci]|nr:Nucleoporin NDC1 [Quaeritorhiza haematococci]